MKYLITADGVPPFITKWFEIENNWIEEINMIVYDLVNMVYMTDGISWQEIQIDHL